MIRKISRFAIVALACAVAGMAQADWLSDRATTDGSFPATLSDTTQATAEAARTLRLLGRLSEASPAEGFVVRGDYDGTGSLSRRIVASAASGQPTAALVARLLTHQNPDGGYGELPGYDSNPLDTSFALEALATSGPNAASTGRAIGFLQRLQGANGAWIGVDGGSDLYSTAIAARAMFAFRTQFAGVDASAANATRFLLSTRNGGALWGEDFLSAQALLTLATVSSDLASMQLSAAALRGAQRTDGSWSNDVFSTALAMRALRIAETRGGTPVAGGSLSGYVKRAGTNEPLPGATVAITSASGVSAQTNADGFFSLAGIPAGNQTLLASKTGFVSSSTVGAVRAGQTTDAGTILLVQSPQTAVVRGSVFDATSRLPLADVSISLAGASNYSAVSAADGSFELAGIAAGGYSVSFQRTGYYNLAGSLSAPAGSVTALQQGLTLQGAALNSDPAPLAGLVVDATSGQPIAGAQLALSSGASLTSAANGAFTFANVPRGGYQLEINAPGYETRIYSFTFAPGATGELGSLALYATTGSAAPTTLTLIGTVVDAVDNRALAGATITLAQTGDTATSDSEGRFTLANLADLTFELTISAADHTTRSFNGTASGYGQSAGTFALPPAGGSNTASDSTLRGTVSDAFTNAPIAGAQLSIPGSTLSVVSAADGTFEIDDIESLAFTLNANALLYSPRTYALDLTQHGNYQIEVALTLAPATTSDRLQIVAFNAQSGASGANTTQLFNARITNLTSEAQSVILLADVIDATGQTVATVSPYAPGSTTPITQVNFVGDDTLDLVFPWNTLQFAPGGYRIAVRIVEPGTVSRDLPSGVVIASAETLTQVTASSSILGQVAFDPPLTQAGTTIPVNLSAVVVNAGNVPLSGAFTLTIAQGTGPALATFHANAALVPVGNTATLDFGSWVPTTTGDLAVTVRADDDGTQGTIAGTLYVGDKASGMFTVSRNVVPLGDQTVHARVSLQGVDVRTGTSTDPLFVAVRESVRRGGVFVGPAARQWNETNRCLGCHIQSQSLTGMAIAMDKADISRDDVRYLYNNIVASLQADGRLVPSHTEVPQTQTTLHIWALANWPDARQVFRTLYRGSVYQLGRIVNAANNRSYWSADHCSVWLCNNEGQTMTSAKGLAATLRMAEQLGGTPANDYVWEDTGTDFQFRDMLDIEKGPDGQIWYIDAPGQLHARDLATGVNRLVATNLGSPAIGLAFRDGNAYVTSPNTLTKIAANGTRTSIPVPGASGMWDIESGPDGNLYIADTNRLWRVDSNDVATVFVTGGLLTRPLGLEFTDSGDLLVSNYNTWNIVRVTPAGQMSVFANGLPFAPNWIRRGGDGFYYAMTQNYCNSGCLPSGVLRIDGNGYVERLPTFDSPNQYGYNSLGVIDGEVYINHGGNRHLYRLRIVPQETSRLADMRAALTRVVRLTLDQHRDYSPYNDVIAMRITTLAESRPYVTDPALIPQIDAAIAYVDTLLRSRQRPDGGWAYINGNASDPYATAHIGLGLEYTNPSVTDPVIRNSITYLLNTQAVDGSWAPSGGGFSTRLGPTSFVMAYMPKALERLGGIDADLKITLPTSVALSSPAPVPTSQSVGTDGTTSYTWTQQGITASGRNVDFDLTLAGMGYREVRAVANSAVIEFANSFSSERLQATLDIPTVRAVSDLGLAVTTGAATYLANTDVAIASVVSNVGPAASTGSLRLVVRAADGSEIADMGTLPVDTLATGAQVSLPSTWNTGTFLPGAYEVYGQLYNGAAVLVDERIASFSIIAPALNLSASLTPDRPDYQAWDTVNIRNRVRNTSSNAPLPAGTATLTVRTPTGTVLFTHTFSVTALGPGAIADLPAILTLSDAATGDYPAELVVRDAFTGTQLATASGQFHVTRNELQALRGGVMVASRRVSVGESNLCTDTVANLSSGSLSGVSLTRSVVNLDTQTVVTTAELTASFTPQQQQAFLRSVGTAGLSTGAYACVLSATYQGTTRQLGSAAFDISQAPIRIDSSLAVGTRGRLLVLMDEANDFPCTRLRDVELWAPFHQRLPANASIAIDLFDGNGNRVDNETVNLANFRGSVNARRGSSADLSVTGASRDVLTVQVANSNGLGEGYRMVATATADSIAPIVVESNVMGSSCGWKAGVGAHFGDFRCSGGRRHGGGSLPQSMPSDPSLAAQRAFLDKLLKDAGWSYKIVTDDEAFERELRTGGYSQYALFSEHEKLDEIVQKELREAVFRGEGLLDAAQHDNRHNKFDIALGVRPLGRESHARDVTFEAPWLPQATASITKTAEPLKVRLQGATSIATFERSYGRTSVAATSYSYGRGKSVYVGYDLLAEATRTGETSPHAEFIRRALVQVAPAVQPTVGGVVPLELTIRNRGIATPAHAVLPIPTGVTVVDPGIAEVSPGSLAWTFALATDEVKTFTLWVRLPPASTSVSFEAIAQSGVTPNFVEHSRAPLTIAALARATLADARALAASISQCSSVKHWLDSAQFWLDRGNSYFALASLLQASDELLVVSHPRANELRWKIDDAIWTVARTVQ